MRSWLRTRRRHSRAPTSRRCACATLEPAEGNRQVLLSGCSQARHVLLLQHARELHALFGDCPESDRPVRSHTSVYDLRAARHREPGLGCEQAGRLLRTGVGDHLQKGMWQGKQLITAALGLAATSRHSMSNGSSPTSDWERGRLPVLAEPPWLPARATSPRAVPPGASAVRHCYRHHQRQHGVGHEFRLGPPPWALPADTGASRKLVDSAALKLRRPPQLRPRQRLEPTRSTPTSWRSKPSRSMPRRKR